MSNAKEALDYLNKSVKENKAPDLVLLDYEMPEMNGAEVLTEIRENPATKNLSVMFLTGTEDRKNVILFLDKNFK